MCTIKIIYSNLAINVASEFVWCEVYPGLVGLEQIREANFWAGANDDLYDVRALGDPFLQQSTSQQFMLDGIDRVKGLQTNSAPKLIQ